MSNEYRNKIIKRLHERYGKAENIGNGFTLFYIPSTAFFK
jgi:hypothetical protein